jgi:hypothetical protein
MGRLPDRNKTLIHIYPGFLGDVHCGGCKQEVQQPPFEMYRISSLRDVFFVFLGDVKVLLEVSRFLLHVQVPWEVP